MSNIIERLRSVSETGCDPDLPIEAADYIAELERRNAELEKELQAAAECLDEAADEIDSWGAYANEYFQDKHDLRGSVTEVRQHAARFEAIAKAPATGAAKDGE